MMDKNTHEEYVTSEQAKQLFELGFDWQCRGSYHALSNLRIAAYPVNYNQRDIDQRIICSAPTLAQAQRWLREVKGIAVCVQSFDSNKDPRYGNFWWKEYYLPNCEERGPQWTEWWISGHHPIFTNYEEALSDGISKMLELMNYKTPEFEGIKNTKH